MVGNVASDLETIEDLQGPGSLVGWAGAHDSDGCHDFDGCPLNMRFIFTVRYLVAGCRPLFATMIKNTIAQGCASKLSRFLLYAPFAVEM
jgi:hypothetical protein